MVYVFTVHEFNREQNNQQIDIFSDNGEYLYTGNIQFDESVFFASPENMDILDNNLFVILYTKKERKSKIAKYKLTIPIQTR